MDRTPCSISWTESIQSLTEQPHWTPMIPNCNLQLLSRNSTKSHRKFTSTGIYFRRFSCNPPSKANGSIRGVNASCRPVCSYQNCYTIKWTFMWLHADTFGSTPAFLRFAFSVKAFSVPNVAAWQGGLVGQLCQRFLQTNSEETSDAEVQRFILWTS